ncbi:recombinase [Pleomorphomonas diazotrophica]|uniref:Recombinase n=1 Tax=Pleomorphomonas diazotrophica TaxID=1166257 RepID=A0A1I4RPZ4_9HYPH|nr:recombinase family protein [Pleomorphomonas diazotrophica]PKR88125.1 recombinase [Pleomorphomonas diazotrophica]SFM54352.1 Site-specific DNA recombinase [Pleomorphomonas diazotrophica]
MSKVVLYARVSTKDQNLSLQEVQARAAGFEITDVVADHGVSGVSTKLAERPNGRRLFDMLRAGDTLVVRWVDRLGRNYEDVTDTMREFMRRGVIIKTVINGFTFDGATKDPMQRAVRDSLIGFMAAMAQAEDEVRKEARRGAIEAAKAIEGKYLGRKPSYSREGLTTVLDMLSLNKGASEIAKATGLSRQAVYRIKEDPAGAEKALVAWGY